MVFNKERLLILKPIKDMIAGEKHISHGVTHGLTEAGYDIRIAQTIKFDPSRPKYTIEVSENGNVSFQQGRFVLASAIEEFQMPENLVGVVHDKSTWARRGLSVFNTVIEPGWKGFLTLELVYHGTEELLIPAGSGIAQVIFHELIIDAAYDGKYNNQEAGPQQARMSV